VLCSFILLSAVATPLPKNKQLNVSSAASFDNEFTRFNGHRQAKGVLLTWCFSTPGNAVSFVVERSYDGEFFESLGEVTPGAKNEYKDSAVYPGYIHYRIKALMYDGSAVYSNVEIVRIVRNG
jgi:hypothetical protein